MATLTARRCYLLPSHRARLGRSFITARQVTRHEQELIHHLDPANLIAAVVMCAQCHQELQVDHAGLTSVVLSGLSGVQHIHYR